MKPAISSVLFALPLALLACGGDDGPSVVVVDADTTGDVDACVSAKPTAMNGAFTMKGNRLHLDDMTPVAHGGCGATASYGTPTIGQQLANGEVEDVCVTNSPAGFIGYQGLLNTDAEPDVLDIELYKGYGAFATGEIRTGTFPLTGDELQYADCGVCVLVLADINAQGMPTTLYMATGGSVTITSVSPNITGTLSNVTFTHVDINTTTLMSTPNADNCPSAITSASFDALVEFE